MGATALRGVITGSNTRIELYDGTAALAATSLSSSALIYVTAVYDLP